MKPSLEASSDVSPGPRVDGSVGAGSDVSPRAALDVSARYRNDVSPGDGADVSPDPGGDGLCLWCRRELSDRKDKRHCGRRCRQSHWRVLRQASLEYSNDAAKRLAYADPPFPGKARYYRDQPTYAGEVDHEALIRQLETYDGWALSTSSDALQGVLPLCPPGVRICGWGKPKPVPKATRGLHSNWEPLIVKQARQLPPGVSDWISAQPARHGGTLIGRKPVKFVLWMFACLGADAHTDTLDDLFPGTGIVGRCWRLLGEAA